MPTVTIPFLNEGKPFDIHLYVEDLETYEEKEKKAITEGKRLSSLVRARADFVRLRLEESPTPGVKDLKVRLAVDQVDEAFWTIWRAAQGRGPDPLE